MKVALCQINTILGNFDYNYDKILKYYNISINLNSDIVVFPELVITGYPPQDLLLNNEFINENLNVLSKIAKNSTKPIIIGYVRAGKKNIYNSAAICFDGKFQSSYDKVLLPTYDVFDEERYFTSGIEPKVSTIPVGKNVLNVGLQICEDLWDNNYKCKVSAIQKELGADILINISASPFHKDRLVKRRSIIEEKVKSLNLPFLYCNMVGAQDELIFDGQSIGLSDRGNLIAYGNPFEEEVVLVDTNRKQELNVNFQSAEEKTYNALCIGVKDYFYKTGHKEAVIGLSGGIDSALVAAIATEALGRDKVHGVSLPSKYSSDHSLKDAEDLTSTLGISYQVIPIQKCVDEMEQTLKSCFSGHSPNVAEENIQARIRGDILMALSNKFGWMVLSTGNKTELALGYCTLYGDMSGGLSVISDLSKTDVYSLANWINSKYPGRIPVGSIKKPPSAELAPNQVDPYDYDIVSPLVDLIIEEGKTIIQLSELGIDKELVNLIYQKIRLSEYKRRQAAPGLRVSTKAFGIGRRFPIVNHFKN